MKCLGILTAGGDTPTLNATVHGAVVRANQLKVEIVGLIKGFNCLFNPRVPQVHLNPLFQEIPELDPTKGGTLNSISVLQYNSDKAFHVEGYDANRFRDRWGVIHARKLHPALYDTKLMKSPKLGIDYLLPIFTGAIGNDDAEHMRSTLFDPGNLVQSYHSINTDVYKRIHYLETEAV